MREDSMGVNLSDNLSGVPGLQILNRENYAQDLQISIRGFGAHATFGVQGVRIYVDGIPATMPDGQGQTSNIDIDAIDHIEVLRGPFSALYGNASGGVLLVTTKEGKQPDQIQSTFSVGSNHSFHYGAQATGASADGNFDYAVDASRFTTEGFRDHSAARKSLGNVKLGINLDDDSHLTIIGNSVDLSAQDPLGLTRAQLESDPHAAPLADEYNTRKTVTQTQGGLVYDRAIDADDSLRAMVYAGHRSTTQYESIPPSTQANPLQAGGVIGLQDDYAGTDLRWTAQRSLASQPLTIIGGISYDQLQEHRTGYENFFGTTADPTELGVKGSLRQDVTNNVYDVGPYVQTAWKFAPRWELDAGLRYNTVNFDSHDHYIVGINGDDSGSANYHQMQPVGAIRYSPTDNTSIYASYGRGFETPTDDELAYQPDGDAGLNLALKPSTSNNYEIGGKAQVGNNLFTLAAFLINTNDEIVAASSDNGRATYENGGPTRRRGIEAGWDARFGSNWHSTLAYSYIDAKYLQTISGSDIEAGKSLPGVAGQMVYGALSWAPTQGWHATIDGHFMSKIYANDDNTAAAPAYFVAGASTGYRWRFRRWTVDTFARVDNVLNRRYAGSVIVNQTTGAYFEPAEGRNWATGVTVAYTF